MMLSAIVTLSVIGLALYFAIELLGKAIVYWER
jgi:ABC-type nitrate/sulfonate/bicarbonate transport system permease component